VYHIFASPIKVSELMISLSILGIVRSFMAFLVMISVSFVLYQFNIFTFNLAHFAMFISILLLFAWGLGLLISSLVFRYGTRVQVLAWSTIWVLQPFSCVFYPVSALPSWAGKIAIILPTTHIFEQLRASLAGQALNYGSIMYAIIGSILFLVVMTFVISKSIEKAKISGRIAKAE
jgi:ABC-2 type transport system permease protein